MVKIHDLTDKEKELLNVLGKFPNISLKELVDRTKYKRMSSISRKLEQFKEQNILVGPAYYPDWGKLCKNSFNRVFCTLETELRLDAVISYLTLIEPLCWVFPVLSAHKTLLYVEFVSTNDAETKSLLQFLKDSTIITDCIIHISSHNKIMENSNLFGDFNPSLDNLLDYCDVPDASYGQHDTDWNTCDIHIFPHLIEQYRSGKLVEILKAERKLGRTWTYEQIKYSREKMVKNKFIKKEYVIFPFPYHQCVHFILALKSEDLRLTQRMACNFAKGARVYKEYIICEDMTLVEFVSHSSFLTNLMYKLDSINGITEKGIYQIRSLFPSEYTLLRPPELKYFDFETQTIAYPYHVYKEKIKEKRESEQGS